MRRNGLDGNSTSYGESRYTDVVGTHKASALGGFESSRDTTNIISLLHRLQDRLDTLLQA